MSDILNQFIPIFLSPLGFLFYFSYLWVLAILSKKAT